MNRAARRIAVLLALLVAVAAVSEAASTIMPLGQVKPGMKGRGRTVFSGTKIEEFDAEIIGTWGCPPKYYPEVLRLCIDRKIALEPFVEIRPMSQIEKVFEQAHHGQLGKRVILTPDF